MRLGTETGSKILEPDDDAIERALRNLPRNMEESFVVLVASEEHSDFMQACPETSSAFRVEYRDGPAGRHYAMGGVPMETVVSLFRTYRRGGTSWAHHFPWEDVTTDVS